LPPDSSHQRWRFALKRTISEQSQHRRTSLEQPPLREHDPRRFLPRSERREPEIPLESRLIGRIDPRPFAHILRLVPKSIRHPRHALPPPPKPDLHTPP